MTNVESDVCGCSECFGEPTETTSGNHAQPPAKHDQKERDAKFKRDLAHVINMHSRENGSNTPDFALAEYLFNCLETFDKAVSSRARYYAKTTLDKGAAHAV